MCSSDKWKQTQCIAPDSVGFKIWFHRDATGSNGGFAAVLPLVCWHLSLVCQGGNIVAVRNPGYLQLGITTQRLTLTVFPNRLLITVWMIWTWHWTRKCSMWWVIWNIFLLITNSDVKKLDNEQCCTVLKAVPTDRLLHTLKIKKKFKIIIILTH